MTSRVKRKTVTVDDVCRIMETIAPIALAQSWDNVGLLAGDPRASAKKILTCIDLTPSVVNEAIAKRVDLVLAYHPPIFKPMTTLRADSAGTDAVVFRCIRNGIAVYATHTALDAADGGTNDVIASLCGIAQTEPIEYVPRPGVNERKLVVTVPSQQVDAVAEAMFRAGAGHIGEYSHCSFRLAGQGTFLGSETTNPALGRRGRFEFVDEIRFEAVVPANALPAVVASLVEAHPYEQPAYDIYPLDAPPVRGIGRCGRLPRPTTLLGLGRKLKRATKARGVQIVGPPDRKLDGAVIVVGAAGSLPFRLPLTRSDVIVTGEIRHHDALTIERRDSTAIALGHWTSERPVLASLGDRIKKQLAGVSVTVSSADREPFAPV